MKIFITILFFAFTILSLGSCQNEGLPLRPADVTGIAAKVNDKTIASEYFNAIYGRFLQDLRSFNPGSPVDKETMQWAKRYVLDEIIKRELIIQEAKRIKFSIGDDEVEEKIKKDFFTGKDGKFDKTKYLWAINNPNNNLKLIRESIKEELFYIKFYEYMTNREKASDEEVSAEYIKRNEKVKIQYTVVKSASISDTEITDKDIEIYFNAHKENYRLPQRVKTKYLLITPDNVQEDTTTQQEIKSYYEKHLEEFQEQERVKAGHIMIAAPPNADTNTLKEKKAEAEKILEKLKAGADFAEIAKNYSQDTRTALRGGEIGYLKKGSMNKEIEDAVFSLQPGQISKVEKSPFGFHIFKVEQKKPAGIADFEEVKNKIRNKISIEKREKGAKELTEDISKKTKNLAELEKSAIVYGKRLTETTYFSEKDFLDTIGYNPEFNRSAFTLKPGEIDTKVFALEWSPGKLIGFAILGVVDKIDTCIPPFKDVAGNVKNDYKKGKGKEIADRKANEIKMKLKDSTNFETAVKESGQTPKEAIFTRFQYYIEGIGYVPELVRTSFDSAPGEISMLNIPDGICLFRITEKTGMDEEAFKKEKENLKKSLIQQKNSQAFEKWYQELKARSKITVYIETGN